jgi:hypothetical protein
MSKKRRSNPPFPFAPNQTAQPSEIQDGVVLFTDVNGDGAWATQELCQAYGYTWDNQNQMCRAFIPNANIENIGTETTNMIKGGNNEIRDGVNNTMIAGQNNLVLGLNTSDNITGDMNQMDARVSNTILMGTLGNATTSNAFVQGGNSPQRIIDEETGEEIYKDILGQHQLTKIMMSNRIYRTTERDILWLNDVENVCYPIPDDAVCMFAADVLGTQTQGRTPGEFMSFKVRGVIRKQTASGRGTSIFWTTTPQDFSMSLGYDCSGAIYTDADGIDYLTIAVNSGKTDGEVMWVASIEITQLQTKGI